MKLLTEYLDRAVNLERLAVSEPDSAFRTELLNQAAAYRELAARRAEQYGLPAPSPPDSNGVRGTGLGPFQQPPDLGRPDSIVAFASAPRNRLLRVFQHLREPGRPSTLEPVHHVMGHSDLVHVILPTRRPQDPGSRVPTVRLAARRIGGTTVEFAEGLEYLVDGDESLEAGGCPQRGARSGRGSIRCP